jgi:hypothetical protein
LGPVIALLGWLRVRPRRGYEIHQQVSAPTGLGLFWRVKQSQFHAAVWRFRISQVEALLRWLDHCADAASRKDWG